MGKIEKNCNPSDKIVRKLKLKKSCKQTSFNIIKWKTDNLNVNDLPETILLKIFSFLSHLDLSTNVRAVCKQWMRISSDYSLWKFIVAGPNIPSRILYRWLENSPKLVTLIVGHRNDAGDILKRVQKYNKDIINLAIEYCEGSPYNENIPSDLLCNILIRCCYLQYLSLQGSSVISFKFFRLLASVKTILKNRKRNVIQGLIPSSVYFTGRIFEPQLRAYLQSAFEVKTEERSYLSIQVPLPNNAGDVIKRFVLEKEEDILHILSSVNK